jgi:hypothetical protein
MISRRIVAVGIMLVMTHRDGDAINDVFWWGKNARGQEPISPRKENS